MTGNGPSRAQELGWRLYCLTSQLIGMRASFDGRRPPAEHCQDTADDHGPSRPRESRGIPTACDHGPPTIHVVGAAVLLVAVKSLLRLVGARRSIALVERLTAITRRQPSDEHAFVQSVASAVVFASTLFPGRARCLEQSLAIHWRLRRAGVNSALRFGVRAYPFAAHVWVVHAQKPILESPDTLRTYVELPELPT